MPLATIIDSLSTNSIIPYAIVRYQDEEGVLALSDSTSLIEIELPGLYTTEPSYRVVPRTTLSSKSYAIDLIGFSISCLSTNFDFKILNRNDITLVNTIFEVANYTALNLTDNYQFSKFIIRNRDVVLDNKIYLYISNSGAMDTGTIDLELIYITAQGNEF